MLYGGYFGLGMGIILLAIYAMFGHEDIHEANALRNATITVAHTSSASRSSRKPASSAGCRRDHDGGCGDRRLWHGAVRAADAAAYRAPRHPGVGDPLTTIAFWRYS